MTKTTQKAAGLYEAARGNEYVNRVMDDKDLRESMVEALQAAHKAYGRISDSKKSTVNAVTSDKKVQRDLREAADSLRDASESLTTPKKKKRKGRFGKLVLVVLAAAGITLAVSEDARKAVLDALFGPEEEFEYTSTTSTGTSANGDPS